MNSTRLSRNWRVSRPGLLWVGSIGVAQILAKWLELGAPVQPLLPILFALTVPGFLLLDVDIGANKATRLVLAVAASVATNVILASILLLPQPSWLVPAVVVGLVALWRERELRRRFRTESAVRVRQYKLSSSSTDPEVATLAGPDEPETASDHPVGLDEPASGPSDDLAAMLELLFRLPPDQGEPPEEVLETGRDTETFFEEENLSHAVSAPEDEPNRPTDSGGHDESGVQTGSREANSDDSAVSFSAATENQDVRPADERTPGDTFVPVEHPPVLTEPTSSGSLQDEAPFGRESGPELPSPIRSARVGPLDEILFSRTGRSAGTTAANEPTEARVEPRASVDLNSADLAELTTLPGLGLRLATHLVNDRIQHGPFFELRDLLQVPGFGPATIAALEGKVRFGAD